MSGLARMTVGVVADPAPGRGVGVAVVRFCPDRREFQGTDRRQLVGRQGLGGGEVKGHGAVVVDLARLGEHTQLRTVDRVQCRQLIGERFSGGRPGGDHHMLPAMGEVGGLDLVPVGLVDAQRAVGLDEIGVRPLRPGLVDGLAGGNGAHMTQLFRVRATAQQRNQGVMGVHLNIVSPGLKSPADTRHALLPPRKPAGPCTQTAGQTTATQTRRRNYPQRPPAAVLSHGQVGALIRGGQHQHVAHRAPAQV